MYQFVAVMSVYVLMPAQQFSERLVVPDNLVVLVDDEDRIIDGIERLLPLLFGLDDFPLSPLALRDIADDQRDELLSLDFYLRD